MEPKLSYQFIVLDEDSGEKVIHLEAYSLESLEEDIGKKALPVIKGYIESWQSNYEEWSEAEVLKDKEEDLL